MRRFTVVCDDRQARRVERLAGQYGLTEREVLRQLLRAGLDSLEPAEHDRERELERERERR
jgi:hypothetical protein